MKRFRGPLNKDTEASLILHEPMGPPISRLLALPCPHDPNDEDIMGLSAEEIMRCSHCHRTKKATAFPLNGSSGRHRQCKVCHSEKSIETVVRGPDVFREVELMPMAEVARRVGLSLAGAYLLHDDAITKLRFEIARLMRDDGDDWWARHGEEFGFKVVELGTLC